MRPIWDGEKKGKGVWRCFFLLFFNAGFTGMNHLFLVCVCVCVSVCVCVCVCVFLMRLNSVTRAKCVQSIRIRRFDAEISLRPSVSSSVRKMADVKIARLTSNS